MTNANSTATALHSYNAAMAAEKSARYRGDRAAAEAAYASQQEAWEVLRRLPRAPESLPAGTTREELATSGRARVALGRSYVLTSPAGEVWLQL